MTGIYRLSNWIYISKLNSVLCRVKITQKHIQKAKILKEGSEYMFRDVVKKNSGYCLQGINKPITYSSVARTPSGKNRTSLEIKSS